MDHLAKGKKLAQEGNYEDALDNLLLALENDRENPDIHFFIGLCHSSMEEFAYAKYHYKIALSLNSEHEKTKLMWDGVKHVDAQKPPEKRLTKKAAAKERRQQQSAKQESAESQADTDDQFSPEETGEQDNDASASSNYKVTDTKWEQAFPMENIENNEDSSFLINFLIFLTGFAILAGIIYFILLTLEII